ncbi:MAG TPA: MmcQ/YjbR family DNA-binding protein [Acidimicrobiales bacterium]|nr:MmcQ/YjbR family DNA-binding protein [Acidimicrobiales bacterium]
MASAAQVRRLALALPEASEEPHFELTSFRVRGKIFATMPPEGGRVHVFVAPSDVEGYCAEYPAIVEELLWGAKVRGVRVELRSAPAALLRELLTEAWMGKAPARLRAQLAVP